MQVDIEEKQDVTANLGNWTRPQLSIWDLRLISD